MDVATKEVLFVCVHNSGRSQMAEAFFNHFAKGTIQAISAGTNPARNINPVVVEAMREVGIDISDRHPKMLTFEMLENAQKVITMGCGVEGVCPASFVPTEDWQIVDPEEKPNEEVRNIRKDIVLRVKNLIRELQRKGQI